MHFQAGTFGPASGRVSEVTTSTPMTQLSPDYEDVPLNPVTTVM
jgi:hypothetical protein